MSKNSGYISSNSSEYGSEPFPNLSSESDEGNGTWRDVNQTVRGGKRRRTRKSRKTRKNRRTKRRRR